MKKFFTLLILLSLWAASSWAVTVQIGSGTTTTSYFPLYTCYGYNYSQQIYLASEIQNAGGGAGPITQIRFYYNASGTTYANWSNWTVYLGNTAKSTFTSTTDWIPLASLTQVFIGNIPTPVAGTWLVINLPSSFNYTGGNLVVAVDENSSSYSCTATWRSFASGSNRGILYYSDATNPNPATPPAANYGPNATLSQVQFDMAAYVPTLPPNCANLVSPPDAGTYILRDATLNWASGGGAPTGYKLYFGTDNPPINIVNGTDLGNVTTYDPNPDMSYGTPYFWKIVPYNANGDATGCPVWSFTTGPDPTVTTFPFVESFNGTTFAPYGWTNVKTAGTALGVWDRQETGTFPTCTPHSGAAMARYASFNYSAGTKGILVTPPMNLPGENYSVKFWMYRDIGFTTNRDAVVVYYNTQNNLTGATLLDTIYRYTGFKPVVPSTGWYEYSFGLPAGSTGNNRYIILEGVSSYGNNMFVDDFEVFPPSSLKGYVYDYNGNPVLGATVEKVAGLSTISGSGGFYELVPLPSGLQQFKCSKVGYNDVLATIDIPVNAAALHDFVLLQPQMAVTPESIFTILGPTETESDDLVITNAGNGPLGWTASVVYNVPLNPANGPAADPLEYCAASGGCDEFISRVVFATIDNSSACNEYEDFTSISTSLTMNETYSIYVLVGPPAYSGDQVSVWIDYDQNGIFDEPVIILTSPGTNLFSGSFTVPVSALEGPTRLRIRCNYTGVMDPCGTTSYGEVEDYTVNIVDLDWLKLDSYNGTVDPFDGTQTIIATLYASKTPPAKAPGETYTADIVFTSPSGIESVIVPVTLIVGDPSIKGPTELAIYMKDVSAGVFMLKWKYFTAKASPLDHFEIYRNGLWYGTSPVSSFDDILTESGEYCYKVYAVYEDGSYSMPSNEACITYPLAPGVPLSNWALVLAGLLIGTYAFIMIRRRS